MKCKITNLWLMTALLGICLLASCKEKSEPPASAVTNFANLDGTQVVPAATSSFLTASGSLTVDTRTGVVSGNMRLDSTGIIETKPTTTITGVLVHEGAAGTNGDAILSLEEGRFGMWRVPTGLVLTAAQVNAFVNGNLYYNVVTEAYPEGEIRGQINEPPPTGHVIFEATLEGSQVVPPVITNAFANGTLTVDTATGNVVFGYVGLATFPATTITAINVHEGAWGANGGIVMTLIGPGNTWSVPAGAVLTPAQIISFSAGNFYFNMETLEHPEGELRGQIDLVPSLPSGSLATDAIAE